MAKILQFRRRDEKAPSRHPFAECAQCGLLRMAKHLTFNSSGSLVGFICVVCFEVNREKDFDRGEGYCEDRDEHEDSPGCA